MRERKEEKERNKEEKEREVQRKEEKGKQEGEEQKKEEERKEGEEQVKAEVQGKTETECNRERIREFDRKWRKKEDYSFLMSGIVAGMFAVFGGMVLLFAEEDRQLFSISILLLSWVVPMYMTPFMTVKEDNRQISIYTKLKWMPVDRWDIFRVRMGYVTAYCRKMITILLVGKLAVAFICGSFSVWTILLPLGAGLWVLLTGWLMVYPWKYKKE